MASPHHFRNSLLCGAAFAFMLALVCQSQAQGTKNRTTKSPQFEKDIFPILKARCLRCHGGAARKGDLDLRTPDLMFQGGDSGPAVVKGGAEKSVLYQQIVKKAMPPGKAAKLADAEVLLIRDWINAGAPGGHAEKVVVEPAVTAKDRQFWSFRPPFRPEVPRVKDPGRVRTPLDAFVLAKLEAKGLGFSPDAAPATLVRRVYFDLLGLPPTPQELDAFQNDKRPGAYERLVDRLLASPHYGERWGRHWLDAAGYADTVGTDNDAAIIREREGLWRYRDYVVRSFNADKPFHRFLTEQLAGDELVDWRGAARFTPEIREALVATGFLRTAVDNTTEAELNLPLERYQVLHDTIESLTSNLLGLTVACARCHSHKFDPISQTDYYRLMACLTPAYNPQSWIQAQDRHLDEVSAREKEEIVQHNATLDGQVARLNGQIAALRAPYERRFFEAKLAALPSVLRADVRAALATPAPKRSAVQKYLAEKLGPSLQVSPQEVTGSLKAEDAATVARIQPQIAECSARRRSFGKIQALFEKGQPPPTYFLRRGNHLTPGPEVRAGFLAVLTDPKESVIIAPNSGRGKSSGRRTALARWLTRPNHPLTARVFVNRVWQHLFGRGIVATPDNFGHSGARPTHPELLDWLAMEFVSQGWKVKELQRLIVSSTVYRQASFRKDKLKAAADPDRVDPDNQLLWRMRLRRLESEIIRDAALAVGGTLEPTPGGPPVPLEARNDGFVVVDEKKVTSPTGKWRRSLYLLARRNYHLSLLGVFDQPVVATNCTRRVSSTVPLQALTLMNDAFTMEQAEHFAARVVAGAGGRETSWIETAFRVAFARHPTPKELALGRALLEKQARRYGAQKHSVAEAKQKALASLCHMLLCANEFLYVE